MALWRQIQLNPSVHPRVRQLYEKEEIPIEIRHYLACWIEAQIWDSEPAVFLRGLNEGLQRELDRQPFFATDQITNFQSFLCENGRYGLDPELLLRKMQGCIQTEYWMLKEEEKSLPTATVQPHPHDPPPPDAKQTILTLQRQSEETEGMLSSFENLQSEFTAALEDDQKLKGIILYHTNLDPPTAGTADVISKLNDRLSEVHAKIKQKGELIVYIDSCLKSKLTSLVNELGVVQVERLERDIRCWKYEQQRAVIGYPITISFAKIQDLAEDLADVLCSVQHQLKVAEGIVKTVSRITEDDGTFSKLSTRTLALLRELYQITFLVQHLPLPIVRRKTKFYVNQAKEHLTVSSLIAHKLNPRMPPPLVKVSIITKEAAEVVRKQGLAGISDTDLKRVGHLTDNICRLDVCNPDHPYFAAVFRHIRLKNLSKELELKRRGASSGELVTDEKFYLLCTSEFCIGGMGTVEVWTVSCPIVVTTHWSQDCRAWGTLLWDYGLSSIDRTPLDLPEPTTWPKILEMLDVFFCNAIGVRLTDEQANCLSSKAIRNGNLIQTFEDLCKKEMAEGRKFSLWDWFYHSMRLAEKHFKREWEAGYVMGFINKDKAEELLIQGNCKPGTFLLRFSDSIQGAISVAGRMADGHVYSLNPFDTKELEKRCLGDKINDLVQFLTVYPNTPKVQVFGDLLNKPAQQPKPLNYSKLIQLSLIAPVSTQNDKLNQLMEEILQSDWEDLPNFDLDYVDNVLMELA